MKSMAGAVLENGSEGDGVGTSPHGVGVGSDGAAIEQGDEAAQEFPIAGGADPGEAGGNVPIALGRFDQFPQRGEAIGAETPPLPEKLLDRPIQKSDGAGDRPLGILGLLIGNPSQQTLVGGGGPIAQAIPAGQGGGWLQGWVGGMGDIAPINNQSRSHGVDRRGQQPRRIGQRSSPRRDAGFICRSGEAPPITTGPRPKNGEHFRHGIPINQATQTRIHKGQQREQGPHFRIGHKRSLLIQHIHGNLVLGQNPVQGIAPDRIDAWPNHGNFPRLRLARSHRRHNRIAHGTQQLGAGHGLQRSQGNRRLGTGQLDPLGRIG